MKFATALAATALVASVAFAQDSESDNPNLFDKLTSRVVHEATDAASDVRSVWDKGTSAGDSLLEKGESKGGSLLDKGTSKLGSKLDDDGASDSEGSAAANLVSAGVLAIALSAATLF
ncbi:hypothetical protein H4219_003282 [Mycoemilia scoparia]|uniref:Uncharacterized protein n=1 Tax=Mycoemilia scoparia TaxID=417184 RepID=A0A9W7ZZ76_9FUNG|nr:hypothetical protein H4219_003282 [Mycoemilia scoparia]